MECLNFLSGVGFPTPASRLQSITDAVGRLVERVEFD